MSPRELWIFFLVLLFFFCLAELQIFTNHAMLIKVRFLLFLFLLDFNTRAHRQTLSFVFGFCLNLFCLCELQNFVQQLLIKVRFCWIENLLLLLDCHTTHIYFWILFMFFVQIMVLFNYLFCLAELQFYHSRWQLKWGLTIDCDKHTQTRFSILFLSSISSIVNVHTQTLNFVSGYCLRSPLLINVRLLLLHLHPHELLILFWYCLNFCSLAELQILDEDTPK